MISSLLRSKTKRQVSWRAPVCVWCVFQVFRAYLYERVDDSYIRTGVEHFVEVGLPVDKFQLVELLIVLKENSGLAQGPIKTLNITHFIGFFSAGTLSKQRFNASMKCAAKHCEDFKRASTLISILYHKLGNDPFSTLVSLYISLSADGWCQT